MTRVSDCAYIVRWSDGLETIVRFRDEKALTEWADRQPTIEAVSGPSGKRVYPLQQPPVRRPGFPDYAWTVRRGRRM